MEYVTVFSSGPDAIIQRRTRVSCKTLVALLTQNILYIYDEKNKTKRRIMSDSDLKSFFSEKLNSEDVIPLGTFSFFTEAINKGHMDCLWNVFNAYQNNKAFNYLIRKNMIKLDVSSCAYRIDTSAIDELYNLDPKIFKLLTPFCTLSSLKTSEVNFIKSMYLSFGYDTLRKILKYGLLPCYNLRDVYDFKQFNLHPGTFAEYLTSGKMCAEIGDISQYYDYLSFAYNYDGRVKEKYPDSVLSMHDKYLCLQNEAERLHNDYPEFADVMNDAEDFSYYTPVDPYCIVMPKEAKELIEEGTTLGHCVTTYAPKVIAGDCYIVFMRYLKDKDTPFLTVEISKGRRLSEVEGANKRTELTDDEVRFLQLFAANKKLTITAPNVLRVVGKRTKQGNSSPDVVA